MVRRHQSGHQRTAAPIPWLPVAEDRRETLERRLDDGYRRIEQAVSAGSDVAIWEEFWLDLLHEYETLCDGLRAAA